MQVHAAARLNKGGFDLLIFLFCFLLTLALHLALRTQRKLQRSVTNVVRKFAQLPRLEPQLVLMCWRCWSISNQKAIIKQNA